ncbi:hypothetical protein J7T55_007489 [Diaporthe amygdali]|uniref:uncharacterized protein n=1 Tax=Phomopsis amygdali TaxID=1214568 RepID=UPI0022FE31E3|nr:uncharacterized protein J7T55_007489 [Diaporthe amygdali]KAJ0116509.1 hypothetical protein J7T55_007489 [Diaporthe amygdali]
MPDDSEPQGPSNPFIRFKNHVNANISTGVSVLTGNTGERDKSLGNNQQRTRNQQDPADHEGPDHAAASSPCLARNQPLGEPRKQPGEIEYWNDWCLVDPYSPHNLTQIPQPTPKDLPSDVDPAGFGFHEAFEDLMSASSPSRGHLMDLRERAGLKKTVLGRLVEGEPPSAWVRRLHGDGMLPPPFFWEHPGPLAGMRGLRGVWGVPQARELYEARRAFEQESRAEHGDGADGAQSFMDFIRGFEDGTAGESFSRLEEALGRDAAEMILKAHEFAGHALRAFIGDGFGDHASDNSHAKSHDSAEPTSASERDQPATEEDLFQMIHSASSEVDKIANAFANTMIGEAPPPAERTRREMVPASETVEYDAFGGKTVRTTSEHVDLFGYIHSKTETRRLNAWGETVEQDTRYSVRSTADAPQGGCVRQEADRVRPSGGPFSVLMTPEQYSAFIANSSDDQLEAFRVSTAITAEAGSDLENLALTHHQLRLIAQEQLNRRRRRRRNESAAEEEAPRPSPDNNDKAAQSASKQPLQYYQRQLQFLEEQNKKALFGTRAEADEAAKSILAAFSSEKPLPEYEAGLKLIEQGRERMRKAREEQDWKTLRQVREPVASENEAPAKSEPQEPQKNTTSERSGWFWR